MWVLRNELQYIAHYVTVKVTVRELAKSINTRRLSARVACAFNEIGV